jgi:DNA-binding HxlR family transcriptional regulator
VAVTDTTVRPPHDPGGACRATAEILARIGDKWSALIIATLASGEALRYNELHRRVDSISQRMLTLTLKGLEQDGLITREQFPTIPPRVEYRLTVLGTSLLMPLRGLLEWADAHGDELIAERRKTQAHSVSSSEGVSPTR